MNDKWNTDQSTFLGGGVGVVVGDGDLSWMHSIYPQ